MRFPASLNFESAGYCLIGDNHGDSARVEKLQGTQTYIVPHGTNFKIQRERHVSEYVDNRKGILEHREETSFQVEADDKAELLDSSLGTCTHDPITTSGYDSDSGISSQSFNSFLPLPWHDDPPPQIIDTPTVVEPSRWTKLTMMKACKVLGVNVSGFKHEILDIILRMEEKRKAQILDQGKKFGNSKRGKSKAINELKKLDWDLQEGSGKKDRGSQTKMGAEVKAIGTKLASIRGQWSDLWVIGSDFNVCRFEGEKLNCTRRSRAGAQLTWSRGEETLQASRIDRFFYSSEWSEMFKAIKQYTLPRVILDHKPIILESGDWEASPSFFKF
ncbi:unnamed protein product [Withania somnifera]